MIVVLAVQATTVQATDQVLKNDNWTTSHSCQGGFVYGESAGVGLDAPADHYPIALKSIQVLTCGDPDLVALEIYADALDGTDAPDTKIFGDATHTYLLSPGLNNIDLESEDLTLSDSFRIVLTHVGNSPPDVEFAVDADGIVAQRNFIKADMIGWVSYEDVGGTNDFVIRATYTSDVQLTVTKSGSGSGRVESTPLGISCGFDCSNIYEVGTEVTLEADPAAGSFFTGWTGGDCSDLSSCVYTVDGDNTVDAEFTKGCLGRPPTKEGTNAANTITGTALEDVLVGFGGNDTISGAGSTDRVCAGGGADVVSGGSGSDGLDGDAGNDRISGNGGNDVIKGGDGADVLTGGPGRDSCIGGPGKDKAFSCEVKKSIP